MEPLFCGEIFNKKYFHQCDVVCACGLLLWVVQEGLQGSYDEIKQNRISIVSITQHYAIYTMSHVHLQDLLLFLYTAYVDR